LVPSTEYALFDERTDSRRFDVACRLLWRQADGVHDFRKLTVWHRSRALAVDVYALCATVTRPDRQLVTAQLKRSALSIPANIAEGCGKGSRAETVQYLEIACGSAAETEHHLIMACDLMMLPAHRCELLIERAGDIGRMLRALIERLPGANPVRPGKGT
jgi:four helix bundle protein